MADGRAYLTFTFAAIVLAIGALALVSCAENADRGAPAGTNGATAPDDRAGRTPAPDQIDAGDWLTYRNEQYQFELKYPPDWELAESIGQMADPVINIFKPGNHPDPPFIHHAGPEVSHVSIFPQGYGTEGVSGTTADTKLQLSEPLDRKESKDYVLSDGTVWASFLRFENPPAAWRPYGFLWAAAAIENYSIECKREGQTIPTSKCDPLFGDELIRQGSIDTQTREVEKKILSTFSFTEDS